MSIGLYREYLILLKNGISDHQVHKLWRISKIISALLEPVASTPRVIQSTAFNESIQSSANSLALSASKKIPFKFTAWSKPIGRPKGTLKQTALTYNPPKAKKRSANPVKGLSVKGALIMTKTTIRTTTTTITTSVELDNTFEGIEELDELIKFYIYLIFMSWIPLY